MGESLVAVHRVSVLVVLAELEAAGARQAVTARSMAVSDPSLGCDGWLGVLREMARPAHDTGARLLYVHDLDVDPADVEYALGREGYLAARRLTAGETAA